MTNSESKNVAIGNRIRLAREQAGLSQGQVAKMLNMHRPTVSEIEAGRRKISAEELVVFADTFGVGVAWLAGTKDEDVNFDRDRLALAARELEKIHPDDLEKLINLLSSLRQK